MIKIDSKDFLSMQPQYPHNTAADSFYYGVACELQRKMNETEYARRIGDDLIRTVVLTLTGYYQDIVGDSGIFRSFCSICEKWYGKRLPIFKIPDDYVESELNLVDLQFMLWYVTECCVEENGAVNPFDPILHEAAEVAFKVFNHYYDLAPSTERWRDMIDVDLYDQEDIHKVYDLSYWLFWDCYLMRPASRPTMQDIMKRGEQIITDSVNQDAAHAELRELNHDAMHEYPVGPIALFIPEWLRAIVDNKLPEWNPQPKKPADPHKYFTAFTHATGGGVMKIFTSYNSLDNFLSNEMGWGNPEPGGHLPQLREMENCVLFVSPQRGMLVAPNVAQFIALPGNDAYDKTYAQRHAASIIMEQGRCPADLVKYLMEHKLVPDATFEWDTTGKILLDNWDFFARLYLQAYYRD